jgi:hypothetical protein
MAAEQPRTIVPRPSVVAAVAKMPPLTPTKKARLRRILPDWPEVIEATVRARHPELADAQPADPAA